MATMQMRWLVAWSICALAVTTTRAQNTEEPELVLKKRIMEEEIMLKFLNQLRRMSQRLAAASPGGAAKRIGSEFLGKRNPAPPAASLAPPLDMNDVTAAAILANQLLNFRSEKRLGSEFLGKRNSEFQEKRNLGSEFLGKKSVGASGMEAGSDVDRWTQRLNGQK